MYLRWIRNAVRETNRLRHDVLCFHTGPGRYTLSPQVVESYRDADRAVRKRLVWTPGRSIRTCCAADLHDPIPRALWWIEVSERIDLLRNAHPDDVTPQMQVMLEDLPSFVTAMAQVVPMPSPEESDFVQAWIATSPRTTSETLRAWYDRCWAEAHERLAKQVPDPTSVTWTEALALFGLSGSYTSEDLKKAYRAAAFAAHPDRPGGSHVQFLRVGAAYELLRR
jgi:hypothetical protein